MRKTNSEQKDLEKMVERYLTFLERCFQKAVQNSSIALAAQWKGRHESAVRMLYEIDLISPEEKTDRMRSIHDQFDAAVRSR